MSKEENTNIQNDNVPTEDPTKLFRSSHVTEGGKFVLIEIGSKQYTISENDLLRLPEEDEVTRKCLNGMSKTEEDQYIEIPIDVIEGYQNSLPKPRQRVSKTNSENQKQLKAKKNIEQSVSDE